MLPVIEKLLILQDRDRKILKVKDELAHIPHERQQLQAKANDAQAKLDQIKLRLKHIESERKKLELEAEGKKQLIEKYSLQQFQTKKNEEYKALAHEIVMCKDAIRGLEDQQLEWMEQFEVAQREAAQITQSVQETKKGVDAVLAELAQREKTVQKDLTELESNRSELASAVEESVRSRYERLLRHKGQSVVVGIQHGVCGGCHMQLSRQTIVSCQADQEIVTCVNCGRILFFTSDMDLAVAE